MREPGTALAVLLIMLKRAFPHGVKLFMAFKRAVPVIPNALMTVLVSASVREWIFLTISSRSLMMKLAVFIVFVIMRMSHISNKRVGFCERRVRLEGVYEGGAVYLYLHICDGLSLGDDLEPCLEAHSFRPEARHVRKGAGVESDQEVRIVEQIF